MQLPLRGRGGNPAALLSYLPWRPRREWAAHSHPGRCRDGCGRADKALSDKPTTFTAELGAKKLTDQPCAGGSIVYHNKLTQGIEALRESFGQPESFTQGRRIFSLNCEKFVAGLSENGLSSRGSEVLQIVMGNMGTDAIHASEIYVTLVYETKLHVTTGVVRIRS